jgi:hypothetical protein
MKYLSLLPVALLAGCGGGNDAPGGVTAGENKALDEAAEMLESKQLSPSAIPAAPRAQTPQPGASGS